MLRSELSKKKKSRQENSKRIMAKKGDLNGKKSERENFICYKTFEKEIKAKCNNLMSTKLTLSQFG